jgi:hypothetical protein
MTNGPGTLRASVHLDLRSFALAALASAASPGGRGEPESPEIEFLIGYREAFGSQENAGNSWEQGLADYLARPLPQDLPLLRLAEGLALSRVELLTICIVLAVESDVMIGRAVAKLQSPVGGSRPTLGLMSAALASVGGSDMHAPAAKPIDALLGGNALASGLLTLLNEGAPLAERALSIPAVLCLALNGQNSSWPGTQIGLGNIPPTRVGASILRHAQAEAVGLMTDSLVVRSGSVSEGRSVVCAIAAALDRLAVFVQEGTLTPGFVPWLMLGGLLPVFCFDLGPGERKSIPALPFYKGPTLALCGPDGIVESLGETPRSWSIPVPPAPERRLLWREALGVDDLADDLARYHRHGCGRIAHLARLAHRQALLRGHEKPSHEDLAEASWTGEGAGLDAFAQPLRDRVSDAALVIPASLKQELDRLFLRCRSRDGLVEGLGASAVTRYRPGVRALFVGPSGTGKTLAAGWLATRLGLPLYRVDLASVTSKYIGETEKNLSNLLARAEHAEVVLLFDEADSLFAKRTDVKDANDRFANAQTNYLLQRIETFDGITILTSNTRARFDSAFARRLDLIVDFPLPGPEERRALWQSHLGERHSLALRDLNQLAVTADLCGGNIRNVVLAAAVQAQHHERPITYGDVVEALGGEYRKLGRQMPVELVR